MQLLPAMDNILYNVQRQGKFSFYVRHLHLRFSQAGSNQTLADDFRESMSQPGFRR